MMKQYLSIKAEYPEELLFYRMGDFYELFFDDAVLGAKLLGITLTRRGKNNGEDIPMCGVPAHSYEHYVEKLIKAGQKVAICEQVESPEEAKQRGPKAVLKREVRRIITGGTILEDNLLNNFEQNFLASLVIRGPECAIAYLDLGLQEVYFTTVELGALEAELSKIAPKELLIADDTYKKYLSGSQPLPLKEFEKSITTRANSIFHLERGTARIQEFYGLHDISVLNCTSAHQVIALGVLLEYIAHTQKEVTTELKLPRHVQLSDYLGIDAATLQGLEIIQNPRDPNFTLLNVLNKTYTAMGSRLLKSRLLRPLLDIKALEARFDAVAFFKDNITHFLTLNKILPGIADITRIIAKVTARRASPKSLLALRASLEAMATIAEQIAMEQKKSAVNSTIILQALAKIEGHSHIADFIAHALSEVSIGSEQSQSIIKKGYSSELDALREFSRQSHKKIEDLRIKYIDISGVTNLRINFNNLIGYYVEVSQSNASKLSPDIFIHKQTLVNAARFTTTQLRDLQESVLRIEGEISALELRLFEELCAKVAHYAPSLTAASDAIAEIDLYYSSARIAHDFTLIRPILTADLQLSIQGGRHPIMTLYGQEVVENDLELSQFSRIWLITGPNMAGKSTFLRQNALLILMAQCGFYIPAKKATIAIVDKIFSRIGAADNMAKGQSTFMVEMLETAYILNNATSRSFIIFDEVGRGTATFDGLAIAWSILEFIHNKIGAPTLFATHYHELKSLVNLLPLISLHTPLIEEWGNNIVFKYKIVSGTAKGSYGIHVAEIAGLPKVVINKAKSVLQHLEGDTHSPFSTDKISSVSIKAEAVSNDNGPVIEELKSLDLNSLTPLDALLALGKLQKSIQSS